MYFSKARENMIFSQLKTQGIVNESILSHFEQLPRDHFVKNELQTLSYAEVRLPLGHGQAMLTPLEEAKCLQALNPSSNCHILEIGTGSGYMTGLLASCSKHVTTLDLFEDFTQNAKATLDELSVTNIEYLVDDGLYPTTVLLQYDIIVITGAIKSIPLHITQALKPNGKLLTFIETPTGQNAMLFKKNYDDQLEGHYLFKSETDELIDKKANTIFDF